MMFIQQNRITDRRFPFQRYIRQGHVLSRDDIALLFASSHPNRFTGGTLGAADPVSRFRKKRAAVDFELVFTPPLIIKIWRLPESAFPV